MSRALRISVAMCTYNGNVFLREQLDSIAAQSRLPDELVICDDGSTDSTPLIVADFAKAAPFQVRWIRNEVNLGSSKNFEKAIGLCTGDLIALSDQDDIWVSNKLARQAEMFERDAALGAVFSDGELVDERSQPIGTRLWAGFRFSLRQQRKFRDGRQVEVLLRWNVVTGATLMIRANLRPVYSPIPACWHHDGWIAWMAVLYSKLDFIEEPLIRYRIHANQQVGVETIVRSDRPSLLQRLQDRNRESSGKHLATANEMDALADRLSVNRDLKSQAAVERLRKKSRFMKGRASVSGSRHLRTLKILKNARNYQRFESGWKCLVGDIVMEFIPPCGKP